MTQRQHTTRQVLERCEEMGFAAAGIAPATPTAYERELREWLAAGKHGEMDYLERHVDLRVDPARLVDGARSVICVADRYERGESRRDDETERRSGGWARVARYARGDDYHTVIRKRLHALADELRERFPDETFRVCVDTAPLLEREYAQRAGIGSVGKHTLIIERGVGSYLLLGEIVTTLDLQANDPAPPDPCGTCTRCIDACPTNAITPWSVDATRCISYLTIEHRSAIDERFHEPMGDWIFGCDICQEVCPHNEPTERTKAAVSHEGYEPRRTGFDPLDVLSWSEDERIEAFTKSAMKRAKLWMMKRNALIVVGNVLREQESPELRERVDQIANDGTEHETVRTTARALRR
jgi:epoxyqueuosine reductase